MKIISYEWNAYESVGKNPPEDFRIWGKIWKESEFKIAFRHTTKLCPIRTSVVKSSIQLELQWSNPLSN